MYGHVSSMTVFEPQPGTGGAGLEITKRAILSRIDQLEPYRRRLVTVPFGLDIPYWIEDPDFDIDYHVRHHAVPPPGTPQQLAEVVSRIISRPLDRRRPLWELYVIEGVENGRYIAQLNKIHHATIDGAAGVLLLGALLDEDPSSVPAEPPTVWWPVDQLPSAVEMLSLTAREYVRRPEKMIRLGIHAVRSMAATTNNPGLAALGEALARPLPGPLGRALRTRLRGDRSREDELPKLPLLSAPRTPFNASIGPHRRFAYTTLSLEDARQIRRAFGVTFNDVVMALCAATLRKYLQLHDALPDRAAGGDGAHQRSQGRRGGSVPQPGLGAHLRAGYGRGRSSEATDAHLAPDVRGQGPLRSGQRRRTAGLHPVRSAGCCRTGDAPAQPAAHRRPLQLRP